MNSFASFSDREASRQSATKSKLFHRISIAPNQMACSPEPRSRFTVHAGARELSPVVTDVVTETTHRLWCGGLGEWRDADREGLSQVFRHALDYELDRWSSVASPAHDESERLDERWLERCPD